MKMGWFRRSAPQGWDSEIGRSKASMSIGMSISQPDAPPAEGASGWFSTGRSPGGNIVPGILRRLHLTQGVDRMVDLADGCKSQRPRFQRQAPRTGRTRGLIRPDDDVLHGVSLRLEKTADRSGSAGSRPAHPENDRGDGFAAGQFPEQQGRALVHGFGNVQGSRSEEH